GAVALAEGAGLHPEARGVVERTSCAMLARTPTSCNRSWLFESLYIGHPSCPSPITRGMRFNRQRRVRGNQFAAVGVSLTDRLAVMQLEQYRNGRCGVSSCTTC